MKSILAVFRTQCPLIAQVGAVKVPGPGRYDLREEAVPKQGVRGFGEVFRFPKKQIFFGNNFRDVPGPDRYRKDHNSIGKHSSQRRRTIKPNRSFGSSSTRDGHNRYATATTSTQNPNVTALLLCLRQLSEKVSIQRERRTGRIHQQQKLDDKKVVQRGCRTRHAQ